MPTLESFYTFLKRNLRFLKPVALLCLCLAPLASARGGDVASQDAALAEVRIAAAKEAFDQNLFDRTKALLDLADAYVPDEANALALRGYLALRDDDANGAVSYLRAAYDKQPAANLIPRERVGDTLYETYYKLNRFGDVITLYRMEAKYPERIAARGRFYYALSLSVSKQEDLGVAIARESLLRAPDDVSFYQILMRADALSGAALSEFRYLARNRAAPIASPTDRSIFVASLRSIKNDDLRKEALDLTAGWLKFDQNYRNLCALNGVDIPRLNGDERASSLYLDVDLLGKDDVPPVDTPQGRDLDLDGFAEKFGQFSAAGGFWAYNPLDKDAPDVRINYDRDGRIVDIVKRDGRTNVTYQFEEYPIVSNVRVEEFSPPKSKPIRDKKFLRTIIYRLLPRAFSIPTSNDAKSPMPGYTPLPDLKKDGDLPVGPKLIAASYVMEDYVGAILFRKIRVINGKISAVAENSSLKGNQFDRLTIFHDNLPVYGKRDVTGDGRFDLYEYYQGGVLQGFAYSPEQSPSPFVFERLGDASLKIWDFNGNGYVDATEERNGPIKTVNVDFSRVAPVRPAQLLAWDFSDADRWFDAQNY